jgi:predicted RNA binding protein YcfA (HicA-like mRNA interferase family)
VPLRPLAYREVKRKLLAAGFVQTTRKGSHVKFVKTMPEGVRTTIVPDHREVALGTPRSILRRAGLTPEEFEEL